MWQIQGLIFCLLLAAATARQLDVTASDKFTQTTHQYETTTQELDENDLFHDTTEGFERYGTEETEEDVGELVKYEMEDLKEFDEQYIDASDMPSIDGRTCFTAWANLKLVEPDTQIAMTRNPKINPMKALNTKPEDLFPSDFDTKTNTEFQPEKFKTVKTPCYRSLNPESDDKDGDAGYCDNIQRYTIWEGQRFCCPQGVDHPRLTANGNMFKCACVYDVGSYA